MEKSFELDFDEWEILPDPRHRAFIDFSLGGEKGLLFSKDIDINYFPKEERSSSLMIEEKDQKDPILSLEYRDIGVVLPPPPPAEPTAPLQIPMIVTESCDVASLLLFKKLKDDELFINTRIESRKASANDTIMPPVEPEQRLYASEEEEEEEFFKDEKNSEKEMEYVEPAEIREKQFGLKIWRSRVMGSVGALCSIGVATATLCIFILGGRQMQKKQHQSQKFQFQICTDEEV